MYLPAWKLTYPCDDLRLQRLGGLPPQLELDTAILDGLESGEECPQGGTTQAGGGVAQRKHRTLTGELVEPRSLDSVRTHEAEVRVSVIVADQEYEVGGRR
jgi:hypothetical protein